MVTLEKNWDNYVEHAETIARGPGFRDLRDRILAAAEPRPGEHAVDIGAGTGLLALELGAIVDQVWAVDIAPAMCEYLRMKAASAGLDNVAVATASAASLPLVDGCVDLVVSNYCFHHLDAGGKRAAIGEAYRVLRPGGRMVFGDMMFALAVNDARDRRVMRAKVLAMSSRGPAGLWRLARNGMRILTRRWERPARAHWWEAELRRRGFVEVNVDLLDHEGGVASARKPG